MSLTDHSASDLMRLLSARKVSAEEIMWDYLDRIGQVNPAINALVSLIDPDAAMAMAREADASQPKGWMHGVPAAPKDLVATKGLRTTWGSPLFADHVPVADDLVAARQRAAGAIFIGKSNTPEWGHGSHSFNPVHGTTLNPYDRTRGAGGSSGGAAAALAARLLAVADGSDMMGSLRNPAAFCNVYGFRPTWGLVPQDAEGDTYLHTLSTEGPMARTIEDLARLLETLCGPNPEAPFGRTSEIFADRLDRNVKGLRIGWLGDWGGAYPMEAGILDQCLEGAQVFEGMGAIVEPVAPPYPAERLWQAWITLRAMLNSGSMKALYADPAKRAQIKPETLWEIEQGQSLTAAAIYEASTIRSRWYARAAKLFGDYDALIMPAAQVWPFPADWRWPKEVSGRTMDTYHRWMEVVVPVSLIGLPSLCLPVGFGANGLPMGMQLIGPTGADAKILSIGQAYHRATDWPGRRPPP
ncbi:amidase [Frigidibacter sp. RF13]|uniref:amidase n=1 Tax=Frigidibacter sp. RF13 TaxID=2997340 RepID=UPI00226DC3A8|nr:amidase [Frigidibacter sp. RF13]MCY1126064.1 amidase [Frigidibacter sp. RF13]